MVYQSFIKRFPAIGVYLQKDMLIILMLGFASGLPLALTGATLSAMLFESGIDKTTIGIFSALTLPYVFKFAWAPLVDQIRLPVLFKLFGKRRGWILFSQIWLVISIIGIAYNDPSVNPFYTAIWALNIALASATQDIVIDAYRVELLERRQQGAGAAVVVFGYRLGMLISGAGALLLAEFYGWENSYLFMAVFLLIGAFAALFGRNTDIKVKAVEKRSFEQWLENAVIEPFAFFIRDNKNWFLVLLFIVLYKFGDAFAGIMTMPFLLEVGFSKVEISMVVKIYGLVATLLGAFLGGSMVQKYGIMQSLFVCGIFQMLSNLLFLWLFYNGHDVALLAVVIGGENFAGGMGTAAFVAYISSLCNISFTATQYALLSSLASVGRVLLGTSSGLLATKLGWPGFFILSTLLALPGVVMAKWFVVNRKV